MALDNPRALLRAILDGYRLNPWGIHGIGHWARVMENGRCLVAANGARLEVVELFALLHDARRWTDGIDLGHGHRGAGLARKLRGIHFQLEDEDMARLVRACANHTRGGREQDITVQTCWDADRLDLPRADIRIQPARLSTEAAREPGVLAWAEDRSTRGAIPDWVEIEWGIAPHTPFPF
jgi:uncharacterized protein